MRRKRVRHCVRGQSHRLMVKAKACQAATDTIQILMDIVYISETLMFACYML